MTERPERNSTHSEAGFAPLSANPVLAASLTPALFLRERECFHLTHPSATVSITMPRPLRLAFWRPGLPAAVLALVSQLALGAVMLPDNAPADQLAELDAVSVLCTGAAPDRNTPTPHRHHAADLTLCPLSIALAAPCCLPEPVPALPPPPAAIVARSFDHPPGRGPPAATARVGEPRAPPVLA